MDGTGKKDRGDELSGRRQRLLAGRICAENGFERNLTHTRE